jgi:hypothetical protein
MKTKLNFLFPIVVILGIASIAVCEANVQLSMPKNFRIIDGICYELDTINKTALVSTWMTTAPCQQYPQGWYYSYDIQGNLIIPSTIEIDSEDYCVVGFNKPFRCSYNVQLDTVSIPSTITVVSPYAFLNQNVSYIKYLILPPTMTTIGNGAFSGHVYDMNTNFPESLDSIGNEAFYELRMHEIDIPGHITKMGTFIFANSSLEKVSFGEGINEIKEGMFYQCPIREIHWASTIQVIGYGAFYNNQIKTLEIPSSIRHIDDWAFGFNYLTDLKINEGVETIGEGAFSYNRSNTTLSLDLPSTLKSIGNEAFKKGNIRKVVIPANVKSIGDKAFEGCPIDTVISLIEDPRNTPLPFAAFDESVFLYTPLFVPKGCVDAYRRTIYWNKFYDIFELDMSPIEQIAIDKKEQRYFTIDGKEVSVPERGLYILKEENGKERKVLLK